MVLESGIMHLLTKRRNMKNNIAWWNYSIEELEQMADEDGKITKEAMEKFNEEMTEDHEAEHKY
jgi:hypothetical protein